MMLNGDAASRLKQWTGKFQEELKTLLPLISQEPSADAKTDKYHILNGITDKLVPLKNKRKRNNMKQPWYGEQLSIAPLKNKRVRKDMKQPWYDEQLSNEIQFRHLKKRKWKHCGNEYAYD